MKILIISIITLLILSLLLLSSPQPSKLQSSDNSDKTIYDQYKIWKNTYHKRRYSYVDSENYRFQAFKDNYLFIQDHNSKKSDLVLDITPFTGLSQEEYQQQLLMNYPLDTKFSYVKQLDPTQVYKDKIEILPKVVNWKSEGAVTSVIEQGSCQSCWAIASIEALEGLNYIENQKLDKFSVQQLVDCSKWNLGCSGGNPVSALLYTQYNGIQSSESYPYTSGESGKSGKCNYDESQVIFQNKEVWQVTPGDPFFLAYAVVNQPVSVLIDASSQYFQNYKSGIIEKDQCGTSLNHAVLLVGYDDKVDFKHYWEIKNSFGTSWGDKGFAKIQKNDQIGKGVCGILQDGTIPSQNLL